MILLLFIVLSPLLKTTVTMKVLLLAFKDEAPLQPFPKKIGGRGAF